MLKNLLILKKSIPPINSAPLKSEPTKLDADFIDQTRKNRLFEVKISLFIKEITIYLFFLVVLYVVAFSNLSSSSFQYKKLFLNTFVNKKDANDFGFNEV
jgi:hypothetical protein